MSDKSAIPLGRRTNRYSRAMPTHDSHRDTPRARNTPELSTSTRITSVQETSAQHAMPARRTHRRLLTPPRAQTNG
ncbi:MAG: hypothetical protein HXO68_06630, partial [Rothia sp.]|nr:hypothetical protein [Rothia sp. (in: high G+C Gram-positive bacteria)]